MTLTPAEFVAYWSESTRNEIQGYQSHFTQLCQLVGFDPNAPAVLNGPAPILFEENVTKDTGASGRADVVRAGHFAWEYKARGRDLDRAYSQLQSYAADLNNPPLLIVSDFDEFRLYPQWPNIDHRPWVFHNADLLRPDARDLVLSALTNPDRLLTERKAEAEQRERVTEQLAAKFARLAIVLRDPLEGGDPELSPIQVARFLTKLIFAIFAEDVGLLPRINGTPVLEYIFQTAKADPQSFKPAVVELFQAMNGERERVFMQPVAYFNGGLFDATADDVVIDITENSAARNILYDVNQSDWRWVSPSIFGTVFERALDPSKRAQLGAHYTSEDDIRLVIDPVLMQPLTRRWDSILAESGALWPELDKSPREADAARRRLRVHYDEMLDALRTTTVLDPACGSGNFLYMSLRALKDLEDKVHEYFKPLGIPCRDTVTPLQLYGIELNTFAAELARVVVWIGYLQWRFARHGHLTPTLPGRPADPDALPSPIIADDGLEHIQNADAILRFDENGQPYEPEWPPAEIIVGNPPFLGDKKMRAELDNEFPYTDTLRKLYTGRVPGGADLVTYWFEKARAQIENGMSKRAGLIGTQSIRTGASRRVLERINSTGRIFHAWSDREWILDGAGVRIATIGFDNGSEQELLLNGGRVMSINPDLTGEVNLTTATVLAENSGRCFLGMMKAGPFDIPEQLAQQMLGDNSNPNGRSNSDVVKPRLGGQDITGRSHRSWIIDFGTDMTEEAASMFTMPYEYVTRVVRHIRAENRRKRTRDRWWIFGEARPGLRRNLEQLSRYIATPEVAKHRVFVWVDSGVIPDHRLHVICRSDDYFFGALHNYIHELWSLRQGSRMGDGNDGGRPMYNQTVCFETFPFPFTPGQEDFTDPHVQAIGSIAATLHAERDAWLNPPGVTDQSVLKKLTLTNLYNALSDLRAGKTLSRELFPFNGVGFVPRLRVLHDQLDDAVLAAYGWSDLSGSLRTPAGDEEMLSRLLAENLRRAGGQ